MQRLPRTIWALGFVSMFMDISSEMVHSLLPVFLWSVLHVNAVAIGIIEGSAEAVALITKSFSGPLSDRWGKRKPLVFMGYALGAVTKPFFALAQSGWVILGARLTDRVGKGVRGAPRDALVADLTDASNRGAAYGLRQSLDTLGAIIGPLTAAGLMVLLGGNFRLVFWLAVLPGLLAAAIVLLAVEEPVANTGPAASKRLSWRDVSRLGKSFWRVAVFGAVFNLARFSEAFLLLRAQDTGVSPAAVPLILVLMNIVYTSTAYPAGKLSDRIGPTRLMAAGLIALLAADLVMVVAQTALAAAVGAALWGLHMGLTQGLLAALVAAAAPRVLRGTAFGVYGLISGGATLTASLLAGFWWQTWGPAATFLAGGAAAGLALLGLVVLRNRFNLA